MHRWYRDQNRAARPPPLRKEFGQQCEDTVVTWSLLLFFAIVLGLIIKVLKINAKGGP